MISFIFRFIFSFILSFIFTLYLVPFFKNIALRLNILDNPDGIVKNHKCPVPYLGGVAVFLGFIATLIFVFPFDNNILLLLIGLTLLLFIGLIDDLLRIKVYQKFFWQLLVTFCFLKSGLYLKEDFFIHHVWNLPLSALWILTVINAFNLIDVMDGLAATAALCSAVSFLIYALILGLHTISLLLCAFIGSLFAFIIYNKPPAMIYLGDAGSLFIGGFFATIPFLFSWGSYQNYGYICVPIFLSVPLFEVVTLIVIRTYKRIPFYKASPDHFCLYLLRKQWEKGEILIFVLIISFVCSFLGILFVQGKINLYQLAVGEFLLFDLWAFFVWSKCIFVIHNI